MPNNNPVTRFGRGFHGFDKRPVLDLTGSKPNAYGPGVDRVPPGSTRYTVGNTGKPLRPGDAALSPDLVRKYGLKPGDAFTYHGRTYRYGDQSFVRKNVPNTNTVEIWYPAGQRPGPNGLPQGSSPRMPRTSVAAAPKPRPSPTAPSQPEGSGRGYTDRSPTLTTNPNDDWTGTEPSGRLAMERSPSLTTNPNDDWVGATPESTPAMRSFQELPTESDPTNAYVLDKTTDFDMQNWDYGDYSAPDNNWWSQPETQTSYADSAAHTDEGSGRSIFGAADTVTGKAWDEMTTGGSDEGSHAFEFIQDDNQQPTTVAEAANPPTEELTYPDSQPEPPIIPDTIYDETPLLTEQQEPPPAERYAFANEPVPSRNVVPGMDQNSRPLPNLFEFGLPLGGNDGPVVEGPVGGGLIDYANTRAYTPGDTPGTSDIDAPTTPEGEANFTAAERRGAEETARLQESGQLPPSSNTSSSAYNPMTPREYAHATFGGLTPTGYRDIKGSTTWDSHAANLALMGWAAMSGNPNDTGTTSDEGQSRFYNGVWALDESGQPVRVGERVSGYQRPTKKLVAGVTVNGRPWNAPAPAGRGG